MEEDELERTLEPIISAFAHAFDQGCSDSSSITSIIKIRLLAWSVSTRRIFSHAHGTSLQLPLLKTDFLPYNVHFY